MYARLVQHILDMRFVDKIEALLAAEGSPGSLRAQFIVYVARNPQRGTKRVSWRRWLADTNT